MKVIAAVVVVAQISRFGRVFHHLVEVDHAIEAATGAYPFVHSDAYLFLLGCVVTLSGKSFEGVGEGGQRRAYNAYAMGMRAVDELFVSGDDVFGGRFLVVRRDCIFAGPADIVDAHHYDDGRDFGMAQYI